MLTAPAPEQARRLRDLFVASEYTEQGIREHLDVRVPLPPESPQRPALRARTSGGSTFDILARCFFLGEPVTSVAADVLPADVLQILTHCGLLTSTTDGWRPGALLAPCRGLWLTSDLFEQRRSEQARDYVMPINDPAMALFDFRIPAADASVLDLCCGMLMHGLGAEGARKVIASDINPRAAEFGRFNAALNDRPNVSCVTGDLFAPLGDERFDLILSNPPFVIAPGNDQPHRDNPLELDDFCRRLVREAGQHLNVGGVCQIICEWVEVEGQTWEARLTEWFRDTGCDVWVLAANRQLPRTYARDWVAETASESDRPSKERYRDWLEYLTSRSVSAVHGGLIFMRRRTGNNWISYGRLEQRASEGPLGAAVLQGFSTRDFLHRHQSDADLLGARLTLAEGARLASQALWRDGAWHPDSMVLSVDGGIPVRVGLDRRVAALIERVVGAHTQEEAIDAFATAQGAAAADIQAQCLGILRTLLEQGCLVPVEPRTNP